MNKNVTSSLRGLLALCAIAFVISTASAEDSASAPKKKGPSEAVLKKYDTNHDGKLDKDETAAMKEAQAAAKKKKEAGTTQ